MKRMILILTLMAALLTPAAALAQVPPPTGIPLPAGAVEVDSWYFDGTNWVHMSGPDTDPGLRVIALARCWSSNPVQGSCNKEHWTIDFTHHASIAQWIDWTLSGSRWDWRVRKPGTYTADCITATLKSNNAVAITYSGFDDLTRLNEGGVKQTIDTFYSIGGAVPPGLPGSDAWVRASALNNEVDTIPDGAGLHEGLQTKLWNMIVVENCNSSCEYEDTGVITISVTNLKHWIDGESGNFKETQE
ncbi:MAG: hypothetical protein ACM3ZU_03850 [Bacteroidota bacterium]